MCIIKTEIKTVSDEKFVAIARTRAGKLKKDEWKQVGIELLPFRHNGQDTQVKKEAEIVSVALDADYKQHFSFSFSMVSGRLSEVFRNSASKFRLWYFHKIQ